MANNNEVRVPNELAELIPGYIANRKADVAALRVALSESDFDKVRFIGHRMKGNGLAYGFKKISALGKELEEAARTRNAASVASLVDEYDLHLSTVSTAAA
jgi:HPt (histidine-containing phosphotransfer) domain-containing protein